MCVMLVLYIIFIVITPGYMNPPKFINWKNNLRMYKGIDENTEMYPYVVALKTRLPGHHFIGTGSLLTPQWVLSAAHCLKKVVTDIQYGNMSLPLNETELKSNVLQMIQHPRYDGLKANDIGMLHVNPVTMVKYAKLSGIEYQTLSGFSAKYAGFGMTFFPTRRSHSKIRYLRAGQDQPLIIGEAILSPCKEPFTANLLCLSSKCVQKRIILPGDSGGPLFFDDKIIAVSLTVTFKLHDQAFTPTSSYITWIRSIIVTTGHPQTETYVKRTP